MKNHFKTIVFCALIALYPLTHANAATKKHKKAKKPPIVIGILVPVQLPAMRQIVQGFETTLNKTTKRHITYLVKNAQDSVDMQRSILQEFNAPNVTLVAPIGTDASQMAIAMIRNKPILGIAANHLKEEAKKANNPDVTGVLDQVSVEKQIHFIHQALPELRHFSIVYSTDNRIFNEVKKVAAAAKQDHITLQKLMVSQLSDLYTLSQNIAPTSQAIFILKDELVVSGLNALLQQAKIKQIPVIASDDGSVGKGAAFAVGVSEKQIGVESAELAAKILHGQKASELPVHVMSHYHVFINPDAMSDKKISLAAIRNAAHEHGYTVSIE